MQIASRISMWGGKRLPYDAEVEYLQSDGGQYINTGIAASSALNDAQIDITYSSSSTSGDVYIFGGGNTFNTSIQCVINTTTKYNQPSWGESLSIANGYQADAITTLRMTYNNYAVSFGSTSLTGSFTSTSRTLNDRDIYLFRANRSSGGTNTKPVRIYAFKVSRNGVAIQDCIAVRKGTVGYLYDRVSGKLFGNEGTGDFVLGPDVVPVEYIESHGAQYIDTGVKMRNYLAFDADFVPTGNSPNQLYDAIYGAYNSADMNVASLSCIVPADNTIARLDNRYMDKNVLVPDTATSYTNRRVVYHQSNDSFTVMVDGTTLDYGAFSSTQTAESQNTIWLFGISYNQGNRYSKARVYSFRIRNNGEDVRKFAPVRVGMEGAMMDTLTRRIYRNAGTGAFTCGNDLKYPIPA